MPGRDGTGPMGRGSMTGRGLGVCSGADVGGYGAGMGRGFGRGLRAGMGCGFGRGLRSGWGCRRGFDRGMGAGLGYRRGFGGFFNQEAVGIADKETLTAQKDLLQKRLDEINKQLADE